MHRFVYFPPSNIFSSSLSTPQALEMCLNLLSQFKHFYFSHQAPHRLQAGDSKKSESASGHLFQLENSLVSGRRASRSLLSLSTCTTRIFPSCCNCCSKMISNILNSDEIYVVSNDRNIFVDKVFYRKFNEPCRETGSRHRLQLNSRTPMRNFNFNINLTREKNEKLIS